MSINCMEAAEAQFKTALMVSISLMHILTKTIVHGIPGTFLFFSCYCVAANSGQCEPLIWFCLLLESKPTLANSTAYLRLFCLHVVSCEWILCSLFVTIKKLKLDFRICHFADNSSVITVWPAVTSRPCFVAIDWEEFVHDFWMIDWLIDGVNIVFRRLIMSCGRLWVWTWPWFTWEQTDKKSLWPFSARSSRKDLATLRTFSLLWKFRHCFDHCYHLETSKSLYCELMLS